MLVLVQWICVHLFVDFILQTKKIVYHKRTKKVKSIHLYIHCLLHGALTYVVTARWNWWYVPLIISITHYCIDLWKLYRKDDIVHFLIDQLMHVAVLVTLWFILFQSFQWLKVSLRHLAMNDEFWAIAGGYVFITMPLSLLLGYATQRWRKSVESQMRAEISLSEAGKWIGIFERILVYTFVIINHFEGIGFLIAAKSVLRFNDIKGSEARKEAEYVLIGTLMSFSCSIVAGLFTNIILYNR